MHDSPPSSFGRPQRDTGQETVLLPQAVMPPVRVPIILVVDQTGLEAVSEQITDMIARAVRAGFERAADEEPEDV